jgi:hypothetical protein
VEQSGGEVVQRLHSPAVVRTVVAASGPEGVPPYSFPQFVRDLGAFLENLALGLYYGVADAIDEADRIMRTADVLARHYRWGVSTSWPLTLVAELGLLTGAEATVRHRVVEETIVGYYRTNDWHELGELVEATCSYEALSPARRRVLRDVVAMIRASEDGTLFNPATFAFPALAIEVEGFARDIIAEEPDLALKYEKTRKRNGSGKNPAVFLARALNPEADRIDRHALHLVRNVIFKNHNGRLPRRGGTSTCTASPRRRGRLHRPCGSSWSSTSSPISSIADVVCSRSGSRFGCFGGST